MLTISRLDSGPKQPAVIEARWRLLDQKGDLKDSRVFHEEERHQGSIGDQIRAQSDLLKRLAAQLAKDVKPIAVAAERRRRRPRASRWPSRRPRKRKVRKCRWWCRFAPMPRSIGSDCREPTRNKPRRSGAFSFRRQRERRNRKRRAMPASASSRQGSQTQRASDCSTSNPRSLRKRDRPIGDTAIGWKGMK